MRREASNETDWGHQRITLTAIRVLLLRTACLLVAAGITLCPQTSRAQGTGVSASQNPRQVPATSATTQASKLAKKSPNTAASPKVGPPKSGPKVANPLAAQKDAAILMQLDLQRKAGDREVSNLKRETPPTRTGTLLQSSSPSVSASGAKTIQKVAPSSASAPPSPRTPQTNLDATRASAPSTLLKPNGPGALGPERTTSQSMPSRAVVAAPSSIGSLAFTCGQNPAMRILNVSGSYYPATFTTIKKYDEYTITGCSFGNPGPNAKVYLYKDMYKGGGFPLSFRILEWHDNWIHLDLDWNLTGLFDQDNLTLVVQRADGQQSSKTGFKFYAAREELLLRSIPRADFSLWGLATTDTSAWKVTYDSPAAPDGWGFQGMTADVQWNEELPFMKNGLDSAHTPKAGRDVYDFSRLQPGFVPTSASLHWRDVCYAGTLVTSGNFNLTWQASKLWVDWQGQNCANVGCGDAFQSDCFYVPNSDYGLDVWVEGPRGLDPWTGLPTRR